MTISQVLTFILPTKIAYAHCDIPCGIYDPHNAQMAAHTVLRMTNMILEAKMDDNNALINHIARLTKVKEDHAEMVKHDVRVIWGDYFKDEIIAKFPEIPELVSTIMKQASKARQTLDVAAAEELIIQVQQFAEIFYESKGVEPARVKSLYPTQGEIVTYK